MLKKIFLYYNTIKYLKPVQVKYQLYYRFNKYLKKNIKLKEGFDESKIDENITLIPSIDSYKRYHGDYRFEFLNKIKDFKQKVDWNFNEYGKLWTYNLNYFEYLHQSQIDFEEGTKLIDDFINNIYSIKDGLEPFPTSLRIINWIKFLLKYKVKKQRINQSLFSQSFFLYENIEYHLQGNHLLENAFALLYAGIYFNNKKLIGKAEEIISVQLEEQILPDGAHFELSPMYHQLIFFRMLDTINIVNNSKYHNSEISKLLNNKAGLMYSWLDNITFSTGDIPLFNDSAPGIAPKTEELIKYAKRLGLHDTQKSLRESGYRKFVGKNYEMVIDTGKIGPDYIPGHGHNDIFSYVLYIRNNPVIVDTGTSVYGGDSKRRIIERATGAHNTVTVDKIEQSEIWGDFRVARRSIPEIVAEDENMLVVEYVHFSKKYKHRREFFINESGIEIIDKISPKHNSTSHLHFDNDIFPKIENNIIDLSYCKIKVKGGILKEKQYMQAKGFGELKPSKKVEIDFKENLIITISVI